MIGIYSITNHANGKQYIGQATDIKKRFGYHKSLLTHGKHTNAHLQKAYTKYGGDSFSFDVLCECSENDLDTQERYWIKAYGTFRDDGGYNLETGGNSQKHRSMETRKKLSASLLLAFANKTKSSPARKWVRVALKSGANNPRKVQLWIDQNADIDSPSLPTLAAVMREEGYEPIGFVWEKRGK